VRVVGHPRSEDGKRETPLQRQGNRTVDGNASSLPGLQSFRGGGAFSLPPPMGGRVLEPVASPLDPPMTGTCLIRAAKLAQKLSALHARGPDSPQLGQITDTWFDDKQCSNTISPRDLARARRLCIHSRRRTAACDQSDSSTGFRTLISDRPRLRDQISPIQEVTAGCTGVHADRGGSALVDPRPRRKFGLGLNRELSRFFAPEMAASHLVNPHRARMDGGFVVARSS
jgi:hypothetical protein